MTAATPAPFGAEECRHNIRWYLIFRIVFEFGLWFPVWILFLREDLGLSFTAIMVLDAIYQALVVSFELPTGLLADRLGRRTSILVSVISMTVAILLLGFATSGWWILASFFAWAIGITSVNGADGALVFESLQAAGRGDEFPRVLGRLTTTTMGGSVVAMVIGGWLATYGYRVPIFVHAALMPIAAFAVLRLIEPPRAEEGVARDVRQILASLGTLLRGGVRFRALLGFSATVHVAFFMVIIYKQPMLVQNGFSVELLGLIYAGSTLVAAAGPLTVTWFRLRFGLAPALGACAFAISAACVGIYVTPGASILVPIVVAEFFVSGIRPMVVDGLNMLAGSRGRATVLSLRGIVDAGVAGPMEVVSGWFADRVPLRQLFLALGCGLPAMTWLWGAMWRRGGNVEARNPAHDDRVLPTEGTEHDRPA